MRGGREGGGGWAGSGGLDLGHVLTLAGIMFHGMLLAMSPCGVGRPVSQLAAMVSGQPCGRVSSSGCTHVNP